MRVHRTSHETFFTVFSNNLLRDRRLSFMARGLLAHLLSQEDGTRDDIHSLAAENPEGQGAIARALRELIKHGYMTCVRRRNEHGQMITLVDVYDVAQDGSGQVGPSLGKPRSGFARALPTGVKELEKVTNLPVPRAAPVREPEPVGEVGEVSTSIEDEYPASVALIARIGQVEPRLTVGIAQMGIVAPLLAEWTRRGASEAQVRATLTTALPEVVHSPVALIAHRLRERMPAHAPVLAPHRPPVALECADCGRPVRVPGTCGLCAPQAPAGRDWEATRRRGAARARELLLAAR